MREDGHGNNEDVELPCVIRGKCEGVYVLRGWQCSVGN